MMYLFYTVFLILVIFVAIFIYNKIKKNKKNNIFMELGKMIDSKNKKERKIA